jgi:hypothetical protein
MKHSWKDKIEDQGLELIEMARQFSQIQLPAALDKAEMEGWMKKQKEVYSAHPTLEVKRKVKLEAQFVRLLLRMHPEIELNEQEMMVLFEHEEFGSLRADELEMHQRIFKFMESDQDRRFEVYATVASAIVLFRRLFGPLLKMQLRQLMRNPFGLFGFIAQNLEWLASGLRGKIKKPPGRENTELAALTDAILKHQKEPLTQVELYEAVKASGADLPEDPEAFRLWLHRARKDGLVKNYRSTHDKDNH